MNAISRSIRKWKWCHVSYKVEKITHKVYGHFFNGRGN